ncbi:4-alpha-glucanotransferase [Cellvibrio sp. PSBB023]|uniref:4-alpha-glucanotransferase n=1 Tax=Cellvibrio sp. PSBB023 TaxID=1945512 RepID=UPI00098F124E|nr:4-alpha-glucanotransferase [Cellvibrio sp. PSBB023]AQT59575.1 4-alpha-glucanotransferase [Cellvibrio sp. PSBB023]
MAERHISTTALARLIGKESKELFVLLTSGGWIVKVDNHWQLTEKGKFEGGIYVNHPKFGEYIAWPESIQHHHLLTLLPEAPLSATNLAHKWDIPARLVNLLLAEKGLIRRYVRGWHLTEHGKKVGGQQQEAESGVPFVTWPETLLDDPELITALLQIVGDEHVSTQTTMDGHRVNNAMQRRIDNWLYLTRTIHARDYRLQWDADSATADFYLPELALCVECWADQLGQEQNRAAVISDELEKHQLYKKYKVAYIEFRDENIHQVDDMLAREMLRRGVAIY